MNRLRRTVLILSCILLSPIPAEAFSPRLVIFIVVDQMREDTFDRFGDIFTGGLKYLYEEGVYFAEARHVFAYSATGPGHYVLGSGRHPGSGGIVANYWYDRHRKKTVYCVADEETEQVEGDSRPASYRNVHSTALGDWMKSADGESKVFSIAIKDRAAVLLGGKHPDAAFWFDFGRGTFTSSYYYVKHLPQWLKKFNLKGYPDSYFGSTWHRLLDRESIYIERSREDDFRPEGKETGRGDTTFPHPLPRLEGLTKPHYNLLWDFPWLDHVTLTLAQEIITNESLGEDRHPDLLCVGLTMVDGVGHRYGPFSQEIMDTFLRLDKWLGEFFNFLDETLGLEQTLIVLTSDHGSSMMPEFAKRKGLDAGRYGNRYDALIDDYDAILSRKWGEGSYIEALIGGSLYYDYETLDSMGITTKQMDDTVVPLLKEEPWLAGVYTREQLVNNSSLDSKGMLWRNSFHPAESGDLFLVPRENYIYRHPVGSGHGSPYDYDIHVPLIFAGHIIAAATVGDSVRTVDVAPTIAAYLKVPIPQEVDGRPLTPVTAQTDTMSEEQ